MRNTRTVAAVAAALMAGPVVAACSSSTGPALRATIKGKVSVNSQLGSIPDCPTGSARSVQDFVPTATLSATSSSVVSGTVGTDSTYQMSSLTPGQYLMGYDRFAVFGSDTLVFNATPSIGRLQVNAGEVGTADYSIDGATCKQH